jgi:DNA repair protein RecN (Recombination protein N)
MLRHLFIQNYALIRRLEFIPSPHLNVITGETGAGKSILLGAIGLLTGNRADTRVLLNANEKCITEGVFDIRAYGLQPLFEEEGLDYADQTIIRREISPSGKSRAFVNDTPVNLEVLKRLGAQLMDIHSQHETLELGTHAFQLRLIDAFAGHEELLRTYRQHFYAYQQARKHMEEMRQRAEALRKESDYLHFQWDELNRAALEAGEQERWENELKILEHAEEIKSRIQAVLGRLSYTEFASINSLREARQMLQGISAYSADCENLVNRLSGVLAELNDIVDELEKLDQRTEVDPQRAEQIQERLDLIYRLQQKHRVRNVEELITIREELAQKVSEVDSLDESLEAAEKHYQHAERIMKQAAEDLSRSRQQVFVQLCKKAVDLLAELGMPQARLRVDHRKTDPGITGADRIEFLFSANKGMDVRPVQAVASGGEFSRLMFAFKYIMAERSEMPTLLLDELDTGVSGETAIRLGRLMHHMARRHQLIAITHLPQIAAQADRHFFAFKESDGNRTVTTLRQLEDQERIEAIARMIGGDKPSPSAIASAREMLIR